MPPQSSPSNQSRIEREYEQAVDLLFDSITPIIPVFFISGEESDHEQVIQAAHALLRLHNADSAISTGNPSIGGFPGASSDGPYLARNLGGEAPENARSYRGIYFLTDEALVDAKALTAEDISMILNMIEVHTESISNLTREYIQAEQDPIQAPEVTQHELAICRQLIEKECRDIIVFLRWLRSISAWRAGLHQKYADKAWTDRENEYRDFIMKFKLAFTEHKTKRTDKMILGMRKYFSLMKGALEAVGGVRRDLTPDSFRAQVSPALVRFCGNLRDRADDRMKEKKRKRERRRD